MAEPVVGKKTVAADQQLAASTDAGIAGCTGHGHQTQHSHDTQHNHGCDPHCDDLHDHCERELPHDMTALVSARGLRFSRSGRQILSGVNLDLFANEIVTLIGPNGAGKTTLVRMLLGLQPPDAGSLQRKPGLVIGYVPQRFDVDAAIPLNVARFLALGRNISRRSAAIFAGWRAAGVGGRVAANSKIDAVLAEVGADGLAGRQLAKLSGGEFQRVVLARALLLDPSLLVLDEPVRGVDFAGEAALYNLIGRIRDERGIGVLLVSHDLHIVMAQSNRVICLNGHICCSGVPEKVAQDPEYARLFGPQAAQALGLYRHSHDHAHDLSGAAIPIEDGEGVTSSSGGKTDD